MDEEADSDLLNWYGQLASRRVDLVGDYAGKELFLIEGDSLLLRCFSDPKLDFDDGFQLLHAAYNVEHFLDGLVQRNCNFHIVFFDEHEELCIPPNTSSANRIKYLLARSAIIRHLTVHLPKSHATIELHSFTSVRSLVFEEYLKASGIYFVMCHDGATMSTGVEVDSALKKTRIALRATICLLISQGFNVALINGLEWRDTKVITMVVEGSRRIQLPTLSDDDFQSKPMRSSTNYSGLDLSDVKHRLEISLRALRLHIPSNIRSEEHQSRNGSLDGAISSTSSLTKGDHICQLKSSSDFDQAFFSEKNYLTIIVIAQILLEDHTKMQLALAFLVHTALIGNLRISDRRQNVVRPKKVKKQNSKTAEFLTAFSKIARAILQENLWEQAMGTKPEICDIIDLIDGRLFNSIVYQVVEDFDASKMTVSLASKVKTLIQALCSISGIHLRLKEHNTSLASPKAALDQSDTEGALQISSVLPFSNPVFDKHLASIELSVDRSVVSEGRSARIFQEISHWHNSKRLIDPKKPLATSEKDKFWALKRNQWFMAEMTAYAASLTNSTGKILEPELVTVSEMKSSGKALSENRKEVKETEQSQKSNSTKATTNRKGNAGKKAMLDSIAATKAAKDDNDAERIFSAWKTIQKALDGESNLRSRLVKTKSYLNELPDSKRKILEAEVELYMLNTLLSIYIRLCRRKKLNESAEEDSPALAAVIWDMLRRLALSSRGLTPTIAKQVEQVAAMLKMPKIDCAPSAPDRKLSFEMSLPINDLQTLPIAQSPREFQLLHCGPYMDRNLDSAPDSRVPFNPDGWQRKVLGELDADRSVFVVAPTSAGKTFISFYAMERVLRANDDGVLVYVAPTKALVNQIAAEIQARFKKSYKFAGKSVWAIHTRDYRVNNATGCQILVTVPHILQIMLLSASNAKTWSPRVRCIIFDEIHSIGQAEDGVVWEQLLLLAPCPIIALSATVGNPEQFNSWLASTQESSGFRLSMITHAHRYSDLRKFVFSPPKRFAFHGLTEQNSFATLGLDGMAGFAFIHPVASLVNKSRGMPEDLSLEPRDCLLLWQAMSRYATDDFPISGTLGPDHNIFPDIIKKAHVIEWEKSLKDLLRKWMTDDRSPFDKVLKDLSKSMKESRNGEVQLSKIHATDEEPESYAAVDPDDLCQTTLPLLSKLHERGALPAILFNYDRGKCESICMAIVSQLKAAESRYKAESPSWRALINGWEQWKSSHTKKIGKKADRAVSTKKSKAHDDDSVSKADRVQDAASSETSPYAFFDPEAPVDGFHFAAKKKLHAEELSDHLWALERRGISTELMDALKRGVGVHHAGMNRKYRQVVEILFRKGYLRVVIATGTLALGINMPCATVVFSGDSVFLTALNFRQAAGRAGRRGFDLLGNVVFQGVSEDKVCRLLSSRLPDLNGHFPVTTTLVLRLFALLNESGGSPYAIKAINSLLSQPRLYLGGPSFKQQVLHHLRFSIEYLRRLSLLSSGGAPLNFAGLISHLYFTENSSFALNVLLKEGFFHEICADIDTRESSVLRTLMVTMSHLFGRRPCRQADKEYVENVVKKSPSIVFLPPLPKKASRILRKHNQDTLNIFTTYVRTFVDQHITTEDCKLPLTGLEVGGQESLEVPFTMLPPTKVRSAFVALSGHGDKFDSISDLCNSTRGGVFLEESVIPHLDVYPDETTTPLNAYLYDFYMHEDLGALEKANGVRKSDVWFLLNDFSLVLATITTSLANFLKLPDSEPNMIDVLGDGDKTDMQQDDKAAADVPQEKGGRLLAPSPTPAVVTQQTKPVTKKKVAESWDDEEAGGDGGEVEEDMWSGGSGSEGDGNEEGLLKVFQALQKLKAEFDGKFHAMWA